MYIKIITLLIFILCYSLALSRKVKLAYIALGSGALSARELGETSLRWELLPMFSPAAFWKNRDKGYKIDFKKYVTISLPFSLIAVAVSTILIKILCL